ncbi:MAG: TolB family protein [Gemmatimonadaceae bacterium]
MTKWPRWTIVLLPIASAACTPPGGGRLAAAHDAAPQDSSFTDPRCADIRGYQADAMEPFLTRDGRYLFFNSSNAPGVDTDIHYARVVDELTFDYVGPLRGANSGVLDGVPTLTASGDLYFVSIRSYDTTASTVYRARFIDGVVDQVRLVPGLPRERTVVIFDVEVSPDGRTLYYARGIFTGGPVPRAADLQVARRVGDGFELSREQTALLAHVNTADALEYAASISADERELYFTRLYGTSPAIYRSVRASRVAAWGPPARIAAIHGFVEAPTLSADGQRLYYHQRVNGRFVICRVRRR